MTSMLLGLFIFLFIIGVQSLFSAAILKGAVTICRPAERSFGTAFKVQFINAIAFCGLSFFLIDPILTCLISTILLYILIMWFHLSGFIKTFAILIVYTIILIVLTIIFFTFFPGMEYEFYYFKSYKGYMLTV